MSGCGFRFLWFGVIHPDANAKENKGQARKSWGIDMVLGGCVSFVG